MSDPLRFDFIVECSELLASYSISLSEAARRENEASCRCYFDALRAIARDLNKTLVEVENGAAKTRISADARHADAGKRTEARRTDDAVRRDNEQRHGLAFRSGGQSGRQATSARVQVLEPL